MNQFKLQNRIFKRILSSKGAHFAARFARIFLPLPPPNFFLATHFPPQNSGAGSATANVKQIIAVGVTMILPSK